MVLLGKISKALITTVAELRVCLCSILTVIVLIFRSSAPGNACRDRSSSICGLRVHGLRGDELSTATAMIASIVLGQGGRVDSSSTVSKSSVFPLPAILHHLPERRSVDGAFGADPLPGVCVECFASFRIRSISGLTSLTIFLALLCSLLVMPVFRDVKPPAPAAF